MLPLTPRWDTSDWLSVLDQPAEYAAKSGPAGPLQESDIAEVLWFHADSPEGWASKDFAALVLLEDGWYAICEAWADTSGWDCRSEVTWKIAYTLEEALQEFTPPNRTLYENKSYWPVDDSVPAFLTPGEYYIRPFDLSAPARPLYPAYTPFRRLPPHLEREQIEWVTSYIRSRYGPESPV